MVGSPSSQQCRSHHDRSGATPPGKNPAIATHPKGRSMSQTRFSWKHWLVPPVLFPVSLVALIVIYALLRAPA